MEQTLSNPQQKHLANYEVLMMQYASGCLDQAQNMIIRAHLSLSQKGHAMLKNFTSLGGHILQEECTPIEMSPKSLDEVLNRLDTCMSEETEEAKTPPRLPEGHATTPCIQSNIYCDKKQELKWKSFYPGIQYIDLPLECKKSKVQLIKAAPGKKAPEHKHEGLEITLLLDGAMYDNEQKYSVGDLIVHDSETHAHSPVACVENGCVCLTVSTNPMRLTGLGRFLNPLIRMKF